MRQVIWRLKPVNLKNLGLMDREALLREGKEYIEKLKAEGEKIAKIEYQEDNIIISLEDNV